MHCASQFHNGISFMVYSGIIAPLQADNFWTRAFGPLQPHFFRAVSFPFRFWVFRISLACARGRTRCFFFKNVPIDFCRSSWGLNFTVPQILVTLYTEKCSSFLFRLFCPETFRLLFASFLESCVILIAKLNNLYLFRELADVGPRTFSLHMYISCF